MFVAECTSVQSRTVKSHERCSLKSGGNKILIAGVSESVSRAPGVEIKDKILVFLIQSVRLKHPTHLLWPLVQYFDTLKLILKKICTNCKCGETALAVCPQLRLNSHATWKFYLLLCWKYLLRARFKQKTIWSVLKTEKAAKEDFKEFHKDKDKDTTASLSVWQTEKRFPGN